MHNNHAHHITITAVTLALTSLMTACGASILDSQEIKGNTLSWYNGQGGAIISNDNNICSVPHAIASADFDRSHKAGIDIKATEKATVTVNGESTNKTTTTKLFEASQAYMFAQHALYRLCEAKLNGFIDDKTYQNLFEKVLTQTNDLIAKEVSAQQHIAETAKSEAEKAKADADKASAEERSRLQLMPLLPR
jgi:hypothetical protein